MFEIKYSDLAGRIGVLHTNHGKIETPAYVPVIHPVKQTIPSKKIQSIGFDLVITNAYITRNNYGDEAVKKGIHKIIDFDRGVMTDSGGYQVLEYGDVEVLPPEMANFEKGIMTDFAIPLDKPTGFGMPIKKAEAYVKHTLKVSKKTLEDSEDNGQIWIGPIQGGEHFDLVAKSTKSLVKIGFKMLALGSPVEFMESYEYRLLAQMIVAAKKEMPHSIPLHLFGAGHPLTIPFAIALGCDTFDSASYMLYAKGLRYITDDGTRNLSEISVFPCNCEICSKYTPDEFRKLESVKKVNQLAIHLVGDHDFLSLSKFREDMDHTRCIIYKSEWKSDGKMVIFHITGNRFLHHMVRYLVGTMIAVVEKRFSEADFLSLIMNPQKDARIFKAPAQGLILIQVDYE